jgi:hypothetical protein
MIRVMALIALLSASGAAAADGEGALRAVLQLRYAAEIGTDLAEMTRLAKDVSVESALASAGGGKPDGQKAALARLARSAQMAVKFWPLCPEPVWQRQPKACADAAQEVAAALGTPTDIYADPRVPWKPFSSYLLAVVHADALAALAALGR